MQSTVEQAHRGSVDFNTIVLLCGLGKITRPHWASACPTCKVERGKNSVPVSNDVRLCVWQLCDPETQTLHHNRDRRGPSSVSLETQAQRFRRPVLYELPLIFP